MPLVLSFPSDRLPPYPNPSISFSLVASSPLFPYQWTGTAAPTPPRRQHKDLRLQDAPINMLCPVSPYFYLLHSLLFHSVLLSVLRNPTTARANSLYSTLFALFHFIRTHFFSACKIFLWTASPSYLPTAMCFTFT